MSQSADKIESHKFHWDKIKSVRERYEENRKGTEKERSFVLPRRVHGCAVWGGGRQLNSYCGDV